jgi:subtilisin family serine protease
VFPYGDQRVAGFVDFVNNQLMPYDDEGHGTHVAGIIAARTNGHGVLGIAPDVTLVPIKVCDASGYCYASAVARGIVHAGDQRLDVVNTSLFADDDPYLQSTQFKCKSDPVQAGFRLMVERAIRYAQSRGVAHVSAIGNSDTDLRDPGATQEGATDADCDVVPAEVDGVTAVVALGPDGMKSAYSSYGRGHADVSAPGGGASVSGSGSDYCADQIVSTIPGNLWGCFQGTSMASPHVAGVAALIVSQFGTSGGGGDVRMPDGSVDRILKATAIDIGIRGNDKCYGHGRVDALRAVRNNTSSSYRASDCVDY